MDKDLIDLTLSDDDASRQTPPRRFSKLSASEAQMLEALPVSNHGLMLPRAYDSNSENRLRNGHNSHKGGLGCESGFSTGAASSSKPPRQSRAPSQLPGAQSCTPKAHINGDGLYEENGLQYLAAGPYSADSANARAPSRFPIAKMSSSRAHTRGAASSGRRELSMGNANRSGAISLENPAKRRKTHGGMSSGESSRSTESADSRDLAHLHTTSQAALHNESQINRVLKRQVFPHIKSAVSQYQRKLSDKDKVEVGEMVRTIFFPVSS